MIRSSKGGGYQIVQKNKPLYKVRTPTWAPRIEENEITYVKWLLVDLRMGYWNGRAVGGNYFHSTAGHHVLSMAPQILY